MRRLFARAEMWSNDLVSPLAVLGKNVVSALSSRMACEPTFGIVALRRRPGCGPRRERIRSSVVVEYGPAPSAAVGEALAVFHHEIDVQQAAWDRRLREVRVRFRSPVNFGHLGPVRNRHAVSRNAGL